MNSKYLSFGIRLLFLVFILTAAVRDGLSSALFNLIVFVITLPVLLLARKDKVFYNFDAAMMLLFVLAIIASMLGYEFVPTTFGFDKVFHAIGGVLVAWFAALLLRTHIKNRWIYGVSIVAFAAAIGGWWEVYEWIFFTLQNEPTAYTDAMLDIIADTIGATILAIIYMKKKK